MATATENPVKECVMAFYFSNFEHDKRKKVSTFNESVDWSEPVARILPDAQMNFYFLFNTQEVRLSATVYAYIVEQKERLTPLVWEKGTRLTTDRKVNKFTGFFDFIASLKEDELKHCIAESDNYVKEWGGGVNFFTHLLNDGTYKYGQFVRSTAGHLGGQIGIVVCAPEKGPVQVLYGKFGNEIVLDYLFACDKNEIIETTDLPEKLVSNLLTQRDKFAEATHKSKETLDGRRAKAAERAEKAEEKAFKAFEKKAKKLVDYIESLTPKTSKEGMDWVAKMRDLIKKANTEGLRKIVMAELQPVYEKFKAAEAKAKSKSGEQAKTEQKAEGENVHARNARKHTLSPEDAKLLNKLYRQLAKQLHPDKFAKASAEEQAWADKEMKKLNALKDTNNLKAMQKLQAEVEKHFAEPVAA